MNMASSRWMTSQQLVLFLSVLGLFLMNFNRAQGREEIKTFRSPGFKLGPGAVIDRYLRVEMPKGHIAIRSLEMDLVTSDGTQVPLTDTYVHHWVLIRYYLEPNATDNVNFLTPAVSNGGICFPMLVQYFGFGSEFRKTSLPVPAPYGIVVGNPAEVPAGTEEYWYLNLHAIDTRGVLSAVDCTECLCDVYNVTSDVIGRPLPPGYEGGILCCHDQTHCPTKKGFRGEERELFLEFTVKYVDYSAAVVPAKVYVLDVTDKRNAWDDPAQCGVEYTVPKCSQGSECLHTQEAFAFLPEDGYVVLGAAHLHSGGVSSSLSRENGEDICVSGPIYGKGKEVGNEEGYVVGMTSCYPKPKEIYIRAREKLSVKAVYDNKERHTGVMGLFLLIVADGSPPDTPFSGLSTKMGPPSGFSTKMVLGTLTIVAAALIGGVAWYQGRMKRRLGVKYKPIL